MARQTEREKIESKLGKFVCTLKKTSKDITNGEYMCESSLQVMNFDKMPRIYQEEHICHVQPKSNDALYITQDDRWYFVEFKNGKPSKADIHSKVYDSVIMLIDLGIIPDFNFARENICYILVYNQQKNQGLGQSKSREEIYSYMGERAKKEICLWDIDHFENYILKEAHTYSCETFQKLFVLPMEASEGICAAIS